jgi:RecB family exonuclease
MRRDRVLTLRLSEEEIALLSALRHAIVEEASQADVVVWALEELSQRVVAGDDISTPVSLDGSAICAAAQKRLAKARQLRWYEERRGRRPRLTSADRQAISTLQSETGEGAANT